MAFDLTTTSSTPVGTYGLTISTSNGEASRSVPLSLTVSGFIISAAPLSILPAATTGNTSTITVTPGGGFTGSVALTATLTSRPSGAVNLPTFSFGATIPVSINGATVGHATLTINTTAPTSGALAFPKQRGVPWYAAGGASLACILPFVLPARRRKWRTLLAMLVALIAFDGGVLGCGRGGGNSGGGGGGGGNPGTTTGSYTVTITGTPGSTTETGTVALTVQ